MYTITFMPEMVYEDLLIFSNNKIEIQALDYLLSNTDIMKKMKSSYQQNLAYINKELDKIDKSLKIECDIEVIEALTQTRNKWLIKLLHKREELEKVNKILAILMLLNHDSCK